MQRLITLFAFCYITLSVSCVNDKADEITGPCDSSHFVNTVKPILMANCYDPNNDGGCHNGAEPTRGNFSFYEASQNGIEGRLLKMKDYINRPASDPLYMPQGRTLAPADLNTLNNWLDAGGKFCE